MILVCETDLEKALDIFLTEARIPRDKDWTPVMEMAFIHHRVLPALIKAIEAIGPISYCYGFDLSKVNLEEYRRDKLGK